MIYRVRVHGQASFMSQTRFSSGWVNARLIDSLGSNVQLDQGTGKLTIEQMTEFKKDPLKTGRRLMLFGPEGFREAPAGHRLVIVMGSTPEKWFEAMDQALQTIGEAISDWWPPDTNSEIVEMLNLAAAERAKLAKVEAAITGTAPADAPPANPVGWGSTDGGAGDDEGEDEGDGDGRTKEMGDGEGDGDGEGRRTRTRTKTTGMVARTRARKKTKARGMELEKGPKRTRTWRWKRVRGLRPIRRRC